MQERRQNSVAEQGFGGATGEVSTEALAISFCAEAIIGGTSGLLSASPCGLEREESRVSETFAGEVEFHLRGKRLGVGFVSDIIIRYKTENHAQSCMYTGKVVNT